MTFEAICQKLKSSNQFAKGTDYMGYENFLDIKKNFLSPMKAIGEQCHDLVHTDRSALLF